MLKKLSALALALVMATMLFAACNMTNTPSSSKANTSSSKSSSLSSSKASGSMSVPSDSTMPGSSGSMGSGSVSGSMGSGSMGSGSVSGSMGSSSMSGSMGSSSIISKTSAAAAAAAAFSDLWQLRLANAQNPLPDNFSVKTAAIDGYDNRQFDARAADALEAMLADAQAAGCQLYLVSAYRSIERQAALFQRKTRIFLDEGFSQQEAEKQAAMWVARPGTSEHNLGLAADLVSANWYQTHSDLTEEFETTPHFAWLTAHAAEYGFVLRYPKGKESITGIGYEPWHWRYVGEAAQTMQTQGLCLEEYLQ